MSIPEGEYNTLLAKYNRLVARFKDLEQQSNERQEQWRKLEKDYKTNESVARELCELILAKDPKEMVLGKEYSWKKVPFRELTQRSKTSYERYNGERTELLQQIQEQSEERRITAESLEAQLTQMMRREKEIEKARKEVSGNVNEETGEIITPEGPPSKPIKDETMRRVKYGVQQAAKEGAVDLCILEEDEDVAQEDIRQQEEMARMSGAVSVERGGYRIAPIEQKRKAAKDARKHEEQRLLHIDMKDIEEKMNDRRWAIMETMGKLGLCEGSEILLHVVNNYPDEKGQRLTESTVKYEIKNLIENGCIISDTSVKHPLKSKFAVYYLSDIGRRVYLDHYGEDPVMSERDRLIAQHDNLEHAFGIKTLKDILEASGAYETVVMDRAENTITLENGAKYIPDIKVTGTTAKGKHNFTAYFEYERGTHSQSDFNVKLNRMAEVTRFLNIVCPNADTVNELVKKTKKWVELMGGAQKLSKFTVRITTLKRLEGQTNINSDNNWQAVFKLSNSGEPILK